MHSALRPRADARLWRPELRLVAKPRSFEDYGATIKQTRVDENMRPAGFQSLASLQQGVEVDEALRQAFLHRRFEYRVPCLARRIQD